MPSTTNQVWLSSCFREMSVRARRSGRGSLPCVSDARTRSSSGGPRVVRRMVEKDVEKVPSAVWMQSSPATTMAREEATASP